MSENEKTHVWTTAVYEVGYRLNVEYISWQLFMKQRHFEAKKNKANIGGSEPYKFHNKKKLYYFCNFYIKCCSQFI